ncbi:MAG: tetratricopeptide repeat protein [Blastocatellia bacterium]
MAMNYCGRCGSANGATARFCRQCGTDLSSQAAASSSSTPFNIEFSTRLASKDPRREANPSPGTGPVKDGLSDQAPDAGAGGEVGHQDPKAISESLRRIRVSGPLILAAIKQNNDRQNIDRINEIIAQSIEGTTETSALVESEGAAAAPPSQIKERKANRPTPGAANGEADLPPARPIIADQGVARRNSQAPIRGTAQGAAQSIARRAANWFSRSNANRSVSQAPPNGGHNGPSTVLMQASGFKPRSSIGPKFILGIIALAVLLAAPIYFMFRDRLLRQTQPVGGDLNLISPEDQSAQLVKAGESEIAQGRYSAAIEHFHRALELAPNNLDIRFLLAQTYVAAGRIDDAVKSCREILRIAPEYLDARLQLAEIYRARGNWNAAYKEYQNIIELNQSSSQAAAALTAIESQQAVAQMEERAKNALRGRRRSTLPSLPVAILRNQAPLLAPGLSEARRVNPPASLSGFGIEEKPDPRAMAEIHKRFGVRYLNIREFRAAINEFLQALNLTPDDKDLCYFIGSSYHGLGLQAEAYDYYKRVDSGPYVGPAESGAKQTRKAAQESNKRRAREKFQSLENEVEDTNKNRPSKPKSVMSRILDSLK